jgi:hypothetical protein
VTSARIDLPRQFFSVAVLNDKKLYLASRLNDATSFINSDNDFFSEDCCYPIDLIFYIYDNLRICLQGIVM